EQLDLSPEREIQVVVVEVLMIDYLSIGETDRVNHTVEIDIVKLMVEMESYDMKSDKLDKKISKHEADQSVITSCYPTINNQLRNSSNPRQQATSNDGRITLQPVQGRQISFATGTSRTYTLGASRSNSGKQRTVICYNYKGEGHVSK
nr:hypothetical protein [Tanacetum cinerariifolium]